MSNTTEKLATDEYINKMYDSQLNSQKEQLTQNYNQAISNLETTKEQNAQNLQKNLNTTAVENQRAQKNYNEVQNAYGLSSGAMAQARLAQDNQLQADLTTLRAAQQTADAGIERERALLSQQYSSAIAQAQADNDLARAEALYKEAKDAEAQLLAKQEGAAQLMAGVGDYSLLGQLYGLTDEQIAKLTPKSSGGRGGLQKFGLNQGQIDSINKQVDIWAINALNAVENGEVDADPYYDVAKVIRNNENWTDDEKKYAEQFLGTITQAGK